MIAITRKNRRRQTCQERAAHDMSIFMEVVAYGVLSHSQQEAVH
jgi:hypothetical protein